MAEASLPRKTPCASCPYRLNAPSGVWHEDEYARLRDYDREMVDQPQAVFMCHQGEADELCAGWVAHRDPFDILALRMGAIDGRVDPSTFEYTTDVPLHPSGAAAAEHGIRDIHAPSERACDAIDKIVKKRGLSFEPDDGSPTG